MTDALTLSLPELTAWGESLGASLKPPVVISLRGELGAGKTTLAQAICRGFGVREDVTSPTFALVHEYSAPKSPVYHVDLYRLKGPADLENIGWDDLLRSNGLLLVEWPERAEGQLPAGGLDISLSMDPSDGDRRRLSSGVPTGSMR